MPFTEFEKRRYAKIVEAHVQTRRPPPEIRDEVDLSFRIENQSVEVFEIRPRFERPKEKSESSQIKATHVRKSNIWKIYWKRADMKWHRYEPHPEADTLERVMEILDEDEYCCFRG